MEQELVKMVLSYLAQGKSLTTVLQHRKFLLPSGNQKKDIGYNVTQSLGSLVDSCGHVLCISVPLTKATVLEKKV